MGNFIFGAVKEKYVYRGYGITFDSAGSWSFYNDLDRNVIIFDVDNTLSSHSDNRKNNFLVLGDGPTYAINGSFGSSERKFKINFFKVNTKFCLSFHYNFQYSYFFFNGKKSLNLKLAIKKLPFKLNFVSESYLIDLVIFNLEKYL